MSDTVDNSAAPAVERARMDVDIACVGFGPATAGFLAALAYLWRRFAAGLPLLSVLRVLIATAVAVGAARLVPGTGIVAGAAAMALAGLVFAVVLLLAREFGAKDREKLLKILRRRRA